MFTQKCIQIFHSVQEIGPFSLFQNLALGKASTDDKCHFAIPWARSFQHQFVCKTLSKYSNGLIVNFHFFQNLNLGKTSTNPKCHLAISWATSCQYTNVYAEMSFCNSFTFFQNLNLGQNSTNHKCNLTVSWGTSCQLQCVCKISSQYFFQFKR